METKIPIAEITRVLNEVPPTADDERAAGLDTLLAVRTAHQAQLKRELTRFTALAGTDHPYVVRLQEQVAANDDFLVAVQRAAAEARGDTGQGVWTVTGRVLEVTGAPVAKVNVAFADGKGNVEDNLVSADTDAKGQFTLAQPLSGTALPTLFLVVRDANKRVIFTDTAKLTPKAGDTVNRELVIVRADTSVWTVNGRVITTATASVPKLNVTFGDEKGNVQDKMVSADTDDKGQFSLVQPMSNVAAPVVFLLVRDPNRKVIFVDTARLTPKGGATITRDITIAPTTDAGVWTVTGRVFDPSGAAVAKVNVAIADDKGNVQDKLVSADTDDKGQFTLAQPMSNVTLTAVLLVLRDANKRVVFTDTEKLSPKAGATATRNITVVRTPGTVTTEPTNTPVVTKKAKPPSKKE